jgi:hypothetical protein
MGLERTGASSGWHAANGSAKQMAKGLTYEQQRVLSALRAAPDQTPTAYMLYACVRTLRSLERLGLVTSAKPANTIQLRRIDMALGNTIRWQLTQAETESSYVK